MNDRIILDLGWTFKLLNYILIHVILSFFLKVLLNAGVNDLGGVLMNESISTAAGSAHGQMAEPSVLRSVCVCVETLLNMLLKWVDFQMSTYTGYFRGIHTQIRSSSNWWQTDTTHTDTHVV